MIKCLINDEPFNWEQPHYVHIRNFSHKSVTEVSLYHLQILEVNHIGKNNGLGQVLGNVTISLNR